MTEEEFHRATTENQYRARDSIRALGRPIGRDWTLACAIEGCPMEWVDDQGSTLESMILHFEMDHPDHVDGDGHPKIELETVWVGKGPAPVEQTNRAARRRAERANRKKGRR